MSEQSAVAPKTDPDNVELLKKAVDTGRVALADIAYSRDMKLADVRDRARIAYREILAMCKQLGIP